MADVFSVYIVFLVDGDETWSQCSSKGRLSTPVTPCMAAVRPCRSCAYCPIQLRHCQVLCCHYARMSTCSVQSVTSLLRVKICLMSSSSSLVLSVVSKTAKGNRAEPSTATPALSVNTGRSNNSSHFSSEVSNSSVRKCRAIVFKYVKGEVGTSL